MKRFYEWLKNAVFPSWLHLLLGLSLATSGIAQIGFSGDLLRGFGDLFLAVLMLMFAFEGYMQGH